jgi:hypothetical protein
VKDAEIITLNLKRSYVNFVIPLTALAVMVIWKVIHVLGQNTLRLLGTVQQLSIQVKGNKKMLSEKAVYVLEDEETEYRNLNSSRFFLAMKKYRKLKELGLEWVLDDCVKIITYEW